MKAPKINKYQDGGKATKPYKGRTDFPKHYDPAKGLHTATGTGEDDAKLTPEEWNYINKTTYGRIPHPAYEKETYPAYLEKGSRVEFDPATKQYNTFAPEGVEGQVGKGGAVAPLFNYGYKGYIPQSAPKQADVSDRVYVGGDANSRIYRNKATGETTTYDLKGNVIPPLTRAEGGTIKAPFLKKKVDNVYFGGGNVLTDEEKKAGVYMRGNKKYDSSGKEMGLSDDQQNQLNAKQQQNAQLKQQAGQTLGAYGSGYYASQGMTGNEGKDMRTSTLGAVSQAGTIGGVIGGVAAIGDQIGEPTRKDLEKTDAQGNVKNKQGAIQGAMIGTTFSPSKRLEYEGGLTDVTGEAYIKSIESKAKEKIAAEQFGKEQAARQQQFAAEGGTIKGPGTGKSDSILSRVANKGIPANSFIVPAENNGLAKKIRKEVLGDNPNKDAKFQKLNGGGEAKADVAVSNGEHLFTPAEKKKITAKLGEEILEELAPNAEENENEKKHGGDLSAAKAKQMLHDKTAQGHPLTDKQRKFFGWVAGGRKADGGMVGYKDGGDVPEGTKLGKYIYRKGSWSDEKGNKLTKEYGQKYTDAYYKQTGGKSKEQAQFEADIKAANEKNSPGYYTPTKTGAQLENIPSSKPSALAGKVKTGKKSEGMKIEDMGTVESITPSVSLSKEPSGEMRTPVSSQELTKGEATTSPDTAPKKKGLGDFLNKNWGSALEMGASAAQIGMGLKGLNEERPVDKIDPLFQANVDKAQAAAKYGFTPEENALLEQQNQSALNAARFAARNYAGGNAGTAYVQERNAINEGYGNALKKAIANKSLMMDKQQYADQMALQKAQMSRNLFGDKLNAWTQKQSSASELLGAGLSNLIGSQRYKDELEAYKQRQQQYGV